MYVKLTKLRYGPGTYQEAGSVIDLPADEAGEMIDAGGATPIEAAVTGPRRNAAVRTGRPDQRQGKRK